MNEDAQVANKHGASLRTTAPRLPRQAVRSGSSMGVSTDIPSPEAETGAATMTGPEVETSTEVETEVPAESGCAAPSGSNGATGPADSMGPGAPVGSADAADPAVAADSAESTASVGPTASAGTAGAQARRLAAIAALEASIEGVDAIPPDAFGHLSDFELVASISGDDRLQAFLDSRRLRKIAGLFGRDCMSPLSPTGVTDPADQDGAVGGDGKTAKKGKKKGKKTVRGLTRAEITEAEIIACSKVSRGDAHHLVTTAVVLTTRLLHTMHALERGLLDYRRVLIVQKYCNPLLNDRYTKALNRGLSPAGAEEAAVLVGEELESYIFPAVHDQHPFVVHNVCAAAVMMVDPEFAERNRNGNVRDRFLSHRADGDTGDIFARLGAVEAQAVYNVIDAHARLLKSAGDERSLNLLRVDIFTHLILRGHLPEAGTSAQPGEVTLIPARDPRTGDVPPMNYANPAPAEKPYPAGDPAASPEAASDEAASHQAASDEADSHEGASPEAVSDEAASGGCGSRSAAADSEAGQDVTTSVSASRSTDDVVDAAIEWACAEALARVETLNDHHTSATTTPTGSSTASSGSASTTDGCSTPTVSDPASDSSTASESRAVAGTHAAPGSSFTPGTSRSTDSPAGSPSAVPAGCADSTASGSGSGCCCAARSGGAGSAISAGIVVVVTLETLLGLDDHPGDLQGHGPITADLARELAFNAGSTWRRMIIDDIHGYVVDYGRTKYKAPRPLGDHVKARDYTCRTPGCPRPAVLCDADHLVPFPTGATSEQNLCSECRHDHRLKHEGQRAHELSSDPAHPPGAVLITTAARHVYLSLPHDYRPLRPSILPNLGTGRPAPSPTAEAGEGDSADGGGSKGVSDGSDGTGVDGESVNGERADGDGMGGEPGGMRFAASDWLCLNPLPDDGSEPPQTGRPDAEPLPF